MVDRLSGTLPRQLRPRNLFIPETIAVEQSGRTLSSQIFLNTGGKVWKGLTGMMRIESLG